MSQKAKNKKKRKERKKIEVYHAFYIVGIIFLFWTIWYFTRQYLFNLSNIAKTIILICLTIIFFFLGDFLAGRRI